jgi:hypothetical protein
MFFRVFADVVSQCLCSLFQAYWAGGLHLFTPLPFSPGKGGFGDLFKTHIFINAGNLGNVYLGKADTCYYLCISCLFCFLIVI